MDHMSKHGPYVKLLLENLVNSFPIFTRPVMLRKWRNRFTSLASSSTTPHPIFLIDLILIKILGNLSLRDIMNCRMVSKEWAKITTPFLLELSCLGFLFSKDRTRGIEFYRHEKAIPSVQNLRILVHGDCWERASLVLKLCKFYEHTLRELTYAIPLSPKSYIDVLQIILPRLKSLRILSLDLEYNSFDVDNPLPPIATEVTTITYFSVRFERGYWPYPSDIGQGAILDRIRSAIRGIVSVVPRMETLVIRKSEFSFLVDQFRHVMLEDDSIRSQLKYLRNIEIQDEIKEDVEIFSSLQFNPPLNSLSVRFGMSPVGRGVDDTVKAYERLLWNHAKTLSYLELYGTIRTSESIHVDVELPIMPKLKRLQVVCTNEGPYATYSNLNFTFSGPECQGNGTQYLKYSVQFPVLEFLSFKISDWRYPAKVKLSSGFPKILPFLDLFLSQYQANTQSSTLRRLDFISLGGPDLVKYLKQVEHIFPNVNIPILNFTRK